MAPNSRPTATAAHPQASANRVNSNSGNSGNAAVRGSATQVPANFSTNQRVYIQILPGVWIEGIIAGMCNQQYAGAAYDVEYTASDGRRKTDRFAPYNIRAAN